MSANRLHGRRGEEEVDEEVPATFGDID